MTGCAELQLVARFDLRRPFRGMNAVAAHAADVALIVLTASPERVKRTLRIQRPRRRAVVTRGADLARLLWLQLRGIDDERRVAARLRVLLAWPMAALTSMRRRRCPGIGRERVQRALVVVILMARQTGILAGVVVRSRRRRRAVCLNLRGTAVQTRRQRRRDREHKR